MKKDDAWGIAAVIGILAAIVLSMGIQIKPDPIVVENSPRIERPNKLERMWAKFRYDEARMNSLISCMAATSCMVTADEMEEAQELARLAIIIEGER